MTLKTLAASIALVFALAGCAGREGWDEELSSYNVVDLAQGTPVSLEKRLLRGLTEIKADDRQRAMVLAAFDRMRSEVRGMDEQLDALAARRDALSVRATEYPQQLAALLAEIAPLQQQRDQRMGNFQHQVANSLSESQWQSLRNSLRQQAREGGLRRPGERN